MNTLSLNLKIKTNAKDKEEELISFFIKVL